MEIIDKTKDKKEEQWHLGDVVTDGINYGLVITDDGSEHFSYLVNHVLAKLGDVSFTGLTDLKDKVNEIVQEDMEC